VSHEQQGQIQFGLEFRQQIQNLRLDRNSTALVNNDVRLRFGPQLTVKLVFAPKARGDAT